MVKKKKLILVSLFKNICKSEKKGFHKTFFFVGFNLSFILHDRAWAPQKAVFCICRLQTQRLVLKEGL